MPRIKCAHSTCLAKWMPRWKKCAVMVWKIKNISNCRHGGSSDLQATSVVVDEVKAMRFVEEIRRLADPRRHYRIMEVCGGHTHAIYRFGLKDLLPENVELIHGPGCPVCVLPMGRIDDGLSLAAQENFIFAAFGDMMRVPGTHGSPLEYKARGT